MNKELIQEIVRQKELISFSHGNKKESINEQFAKASTFLKSFFRNGFDNIAKKYGDDAVAVLKKITTATDESSVIKYLNELSRVDSDAAKEIRNILRNSSSMVATKAEIDDIAKMISDDLASGDIDDVGAAIDDYLDALFPKATPEGKKVLKDMVYDTNKTLDDARPVRVNIPASQNPITKIDEIIAQSRKVNSKWDNTWIGRKIFDTRNNVNVVMQNKKLWEQYPELNGKTFQEVREFVKRNLVKKEEEMIALSKKYSFGPWYNGLSKWGKFFATLGVMAPNLLLSILINMWKTGWQLNDLAPTIDELFRKKDVLLSGGVTDLRPDKNNEEKILKINKSLQILYPNYFTEMGVLYEKYYIEYSPDGKSLSIGDNESGEIVEGPITINQINAKIINQ